MTEILSSPYTYAIIIMIAAFVAAYGSNRIGDTRERIASQTEKLVNDAGQTLSELKSVGDDLNLTLEKTKKANLQLDENKNFIIKTLEKSLEAKEAALNSKDEILGMLTGGDSFPKILFQEKGFLFAIFGKYGIPNLRLEIIHITNYENTSLSCLKDYLVYAKACENISIVYNEVFRKTFAGKLHPIDFSELNIVLDKNISHGFDFIFNSDYKKWTQRIRLNPIGDKWEILSGLEEETTTNKLQPASTLYFNASKDFPYISKVKEGIFVGNNLYYHKKHEELYRIGYYGIFNRAFPIDEKKYIKPMNISDWK